VERLAFWLCAGLTLFGFPGQASAAEPGTSAGDASGTDAAGHRQPFLGGFLRESRILYPLAVGEWNAVGEHLYDDQAYGVSVRYAHGDDEDRWIDLYFYPAGVLTQEQFLAVARQEADLIRMAHEQAGHAHFEMGALQAFPLVKATAAARAEAAGAEGIDAQALALGYEVDGKAYSSAMTLLLDRLYFVKARYSVEQSKLSRNETLAQLQAFTAQLQSQVTILSTGGCWMPLPIEPLAAVPDAGQVLASHSADGGPSEVLLADRVLARDPQGVGAQALMRMGMAMHGQLFPGCAGAAPVDPVVPGGLREIRLEYRAEDGAGVPEPSIRGGSKVILG
jgi:hypothetical protein